MTERDTKRSAVVIVGGGRNAGRTMRAEIELLARIGDLEEYRAIGTVEEFKALKEKQIAKKPHHISEIDDIDNAMVECPICHANSDYSVNTIKSGYCWKCGQKLDWE